ncbi:class I SAM-dependent methyltransferase [Roseateles chitinivorans]|uniref:class I SAM-dependent methyltransferase n=1 Tax=Roseateles chitinivorans TaxID=2917965 RepID=UPI003D67D040
MQHHQLHEFPFTDSAAVASYAERTSRLVPGLASLHAMTGVLLAERAPVDAHILVLGAGGGMELKALAETHPSWTFLGVDPSEQMLDLARSSLGKHLQRTTLHHGYIDSAPEDRFDGATCLLTLHFLSEDERLATLKAMARRLTPGAPLVVAHHSLPASPEERSTWLMRYADYNAQTGVPIAQARASAIAIGERLPLLSPEQEVALLQAAGFTQVELFYAALTFRGWVARKA